MGGRSQVPETDTDTRALFAYEGRRLAQLDYSAADYWLILLDYSAAGSHANVFSQPFFAADRQGVPAERFQLG